MECRHGGKGTVLIFVRCHQEKVKAEVYKSRCFSGWRSGDTNGRVAEWLHGVRLAAPDEQTKLALDEEMITDAERLRVVHLLITSPERDGGAGITPGLDGWNYVESIFPLHDSKFNRVFSPWLPDIDLRNGFRIGLVNGLSARGNWIPSAITSVRNSLSISLIPNITSFPLSLLLFWVSRRISSCRRSTRSMQFVLWCGLWYLSILGKGGKEILPSDGE